MTGTTAAASSLPALPGTLTDSWLGNSLADGGSGLRVPTMLDAMTVWPDGSVLLASHYNEGGRAYTLLAPDGKSARCTDGLAVPGPDLESARASYYYVSPGNEGLCWHAFDGQDVVPGAGWIQSAANWTGPGDPKKLFPDQPGGLHYTCVSLSRGAASDVLWVADATDYTTDSTGGMGSGGTGRLWLVDANTRLLIRWLPAPGVSLVSAASDGKTAWYLAGTTLTRTDDQGKTLASITVPAGVTSIAALPDGGCIYTGIALGEVCRLSADGMTQTSLPLQRSFQPVTTTAVEQRGGWMGRMLGLWRRKAVVDYSAVGSLATGTLSWPVGVGVDASGSLYVACADCALPKLSRVDRYPSDSSGGWNLKAGVQIAWGGTFGDVWVTDPTDPVTRYSSIGVMQGDGVNQELVATTVDMGGNPHDPRRWLGCQGGAGRCAIGVRVIGGVRFLYTLTANDWDCYRLPDKASGYLARCVAFHAARDIATDYADLTNAPSGVPRTSFFWHDSLGTGVWDATGYEAMPPDQSSEGPHEYAVINVDGQGNVWECPAWTRSDWTLGPVIRYGYTLDYRGNPVYSQAQTTTYPLPQASHYTQVGLTGITPAGDLWILGRRDADASYSLAYWPGWTQAGCPGADTAPAWVTPDIADYTKADADWKHWDRSVGAITACGDSVFVLEGLGGAFRVYRAGDGTLVGRADSTPLAFDSTQDCPSAFESVKRADGSYALVCMGYLRNCAILRTWTPQTNGAK